MLRDNVKFNIHNALELIEKHLWKTTVKAIDKERLKEQILKDVEIRLPANDKVCFEEGVTVRSLLANRPGIKMCLLEFDKNGKEKICEQDAEKLSLIDHQNLPKLLSDLPAIPGYSKTGKMHKNESKFFNMFRKLFGEERLDSFSDTFRSALGDKTYEMAFNWNFKHLKNLLQDEGIGSNKSLLANGRAIVGFLGYIPDMLVGTGAVLFYGAGYALCSTLNKCYELISGNKEPFKNKVIPLIEKLTKYSFTHVTVHNNWVGRETRYLDDYAADISDFRIKENSHLDGPSSLVTAITPAFTAKVEKLRRIDTDNFVKKFLGKCNKSEIIKSASESIDGLALALKNYAKGFADSFNECIKKDYALGDDRFKNSVRKLFNNTNKIKTKDLIVLEEEIMRIIKESFIEDQARGKKDAPKIEFLSK